VYDCNGNLTSGAGRIYTWDIENRPITIQHTSGTETYTYDAEGERMSRSNGTVTTFYLGGLWEETNTDTIITHYRVRRRLSHQPQHSPPCNPLCLRRPAAHNYRGRDLHR
jgi:YD repeat-containing protein